MRFQKRAVGVREVAERKYIQFIQTFERGSSDVYHFAGVKRPYDVLIVFARYNGGGVGFFKVAAEFCETFCKRHAYGYRKSRFLVNASANGIGDGFSVAEKFYAFGNVKPAFVKTEMFDAVGVRSVNIENLFAVTDVFGEGWRNNCYIGTLLLRLPYRIARFHAHDFCGLTFGQYDAVPFFGVSAYGNGFSFVFGVQNGFDRGV